MGIEIEKKFLVVSDTWRQAIDKQSVFKQGYIQSNERVSVRVRHTSQGAQLNVKSGTLGISRLEYEYPIPITDAEQMLTQLCQGAIIEKKRYWVPHQGFTWEVDVFSGANVGLIVAEIELEAQDQVFALPDWAGQEVSYERRYYNSCLVDYPYRDWSNDEKNPQ